MSAAGPLRFAAVVAAADAASASSSRTAKRDALAAPLAAASADEAPLVVGFLTGAPRQGRLGVGPAQVRAIEAAPSDVAGLTVVEVDDTLTRLAVTSGPGSQAERRSFLETLFATATAAEQDHLRRLLVGELRQGALEGVVADAVAIAHGVPQALVRRAAMFAGDLGAVAAIAADGGRPGLEAVGLEVGRPVQPMLASTADSAAAAIGDLGPASVEWKLDGIRLQVHSDGERVLVVTRNLNDITERLPSVVAAVRGLGVDRIVLDGEMLRYEGDRPAAFQDTASGGATGGEVRAHFFDVLHLDGVDLIDAPLAERADALAAAVPEVMRVPATRTDDPTVAEAVLAEALAAGHEGVVLKALDAPYLAGRRGKAWRKVKPVHTFDLVVLAAEWGHGRRTGYLSNLHLGARDGDGFVMVGKTFKGLTDELLAWQTARLRDLAVEDDGHIVRVRPAQVVEIALDGVQRSTRYPGGLALRFARVVGYRHDKVASEADDLAALRALFPG